MRIIGFAIGFMLLAVPAKADWSVDSSGRVASVCAVDATGTQVCLSLGCGSDGALGWGLSHAGAPTLEAADAVAAELTVGSRRVGALRFEATSPSRLTAPLNEATLPGFEWMKRGLRADLRLRPETEDEAEEQVASFSLAGSRRAIETVEQSCPRPDFTAMETDRLLSDDPAATVLETAQSACGLLGGTVTVQEGFVRDIDLDGAGTVDRVVYHPAAECSAAPTATCGQDGCLQSLWLAQEEGGFRQVLAQSLYGLSVIAPGQIAIDVSARACGRPQASACRKRLVLEGGALRDYGPVTAQD